MATTQPSCTSSHTPAVDRQRAGGGQPAQYGLVVRAGAPGPEHPHGHVGHGVLGADGLALVADVDVVGHRDLGLAVGRGHHVGGIADEEALEVEADVPAVVSIAFNLPNHWPSGNVGDCGAQPLPDAGSVEVGWMTTNGIEPGGGGGPSVVVVVRATVVEVVSGATALFSAAADGEASSLLSLEHAPHGEHQEHPEHARHRGQRRPSHGVHRRRLGPDRQASARSIPNW